MLGFERRGGFLIHKRLAKRIYPDGIAVTVVYQYSSARETLTTVHLPAGKQRRFLETDTGLQKPLVERDPDGQATCMIGTYRYHRTETGRDCTKSFWKKIIDNCSIIIHVHVDL